MSLHGLAPLTLRVAALVNLVIVTMVCVASFGNIRDLDFNVFWDAGRAANRGQALAVWTEQSLAYPPPFLLFLQPFALAPKAVAILAWVIGTFALLAWVGRRWNLGLTALMAFPPVLINGIIAQAGLLTGAMFLGGARLLGSHPFLAGALFGAIVIKPQMGVLIPIAFIAGREWRAFAGATCAVAALCLFSAAAYGPQAFIVWWNVMHAPLSVMVDGGAGWEKMATVFAVLRMHGVPAIVAGIAHAVAAIIAIVAVIRTWAWNSDPAARCAVLACATAVASPYLLNYDLVLLILPVAWCYREAERGWQSIAIAAMLAPAVLLNWMPNAFPNPAPVASLLLLALSWRTSKRRNQAALGEASRTPASTWSANCAKLSIN